MGHHAAANRVVRLLGRILARLTAPAYRRGFVAGLAEGQRQEKPKANGWDLYDQAVRATIRERIDTTIKGMVG